MKFPTISVWINFKIENVITKDYCIQTSYVVGLSDAQVFFKLLF